MSNFFLFPRLSGDAVEKAVIAMQRLDPLTLKNDWAGKVEFDNRTFDQVSKEGDVGSIYPIEKIEAIVLKLEECIEKNNGSLDKEPNNTLKIKVENNWAKILHSELPISPSEAANPEVWHSFSCFFCPHLVSWRWGKYEQEIPHFRWYSVEAANRQTFRRLWWRAELLYDKNNTEPYSLLEKMYEDELVGFTDQAKISMHRLITLEVARKQLNNIDPETGSSRINNQKGEKLAPRTDFFRLLQKIVLRAASQKEPAFIESTNLASSFVEECLNEAKISYNNVT